MKKSFSTVTLLSLCMLTAQAQPKFSRQHGLYEVSNLTVAITTEDDEATIHYTTDGSEPLPTSPMYTTPLVLNTNTLLRAVEVKADTVASPITTATYLFMNHVLRQSDTPKGYPAQWGSFTQMGGTAQADYGMDEEMTTDVTLRPKIVEGLKSLPILSIVTDKENLFSHEADSALGGIYIFTGPPVGDATGHGWTRPASIELMGGGHDLSAACGLRLHGGHGRLAEKNPKHSFRLVFKDEYGEKALKYPLCGEDEPNKFDQLVVRCHFGNAWQHWSESNRQKAQYTRDVWARRMQRKMGHTSVNALYVHLFLNGMYWGLYNIAERVDDQFGKDHLGGKKSDIDVLKIEEDGGNHIEATEGDMEAWNLMVETAAQAATDQDAFYRLQGLDAEGNDDPDAEALLDVDAFIDYMLINQYGGNTDWDHHNWYALRRRGPESQGFRFLCWDSEIIFESERENVLGTNNGKSFPTGIFHNLLQNENFARRYMRRAKEVLAEDGLLGEASVVAVWDSLYHTIQSALYDEAARWGDYRRDVHPYTSKGSLYTVDDTYMTERNRLLQQYFPVRTERVLNDIVHLVDIDDFEAPDGCTELLASMFVEWDGSRANAQPTGHPVTVDWHMNQEAGGGTAIAGFVGVEENRFADVGQYEKLVLRGTGSGIRILANRLVPHGPWKQITVSFNDSDPYWDANLQAIVLPLADLQNALTSEGVSRKDNFLHLHAIKVDWGKNARVRAAYLVPDEETLPVWAVGHEPLHDKYYTLQGVQIATPTRGIYIRNGKKVWVK